MTDARDVAAVTCLGCGCACDDVEVRISAGRIVGITPECTLGRAWFGDGTVPEATTRDGSAVTVDQAIGEAAGILAAAGPVIVYLGLDLSSQAQRLALAVADLLGARVDTATSAPAVAGLLAAQRRGRAAATLGEIRNRADAILFWAVDPGERYPRFFSRFVDPAGTHVPAGRAGRCLVSVTVGTSRGPSGADLELVLSPADEITALSVMRATVLGSPLGDLPPDLRRAGEAAAALKDAKYAVIVHEAEPGAAQSDPFRAEGLTALAQALNGPTRAALSTLRAGGNRSGAEAALTWQTGYPVAVDFSEGFPRYTPERRALDRAAEGAAVLVIGSSRDLSSEAVAALGLLPVVAVGPRASQASFATRVAIDTGIAGIHDGGTAYRMDDIPLPLRPPLPRARSAASTLQMLLAALQDRRRR